MEHDADYYREKAAQCRRLASAIPEQGDRAVKRLLAMADEFDALADSYIGSSETK